jgi:AraC-like DNA-binding protein
VSLSSGFINLDIFDFNNHLHQNTDLKKKQNNPKILKMMNFVNIILFYGAGLSWTMALTQLFVKQEKIKKILLFITFFAIGVVQCEQGLVYSNMISSFNALMFMDLPCYFLVMSSSYLYIDMIINDDKKFGWKSWTLYLPAILVAISIPFLQQLPLETKFRIIDNYFYGQAFGGLNWLMFSGGVLFLIQFIVLILKNKLIQDISDFVKENVYIPGLIVAIFTAIIIYIIGSVYSLMIIINGCLFSLIVLFIFITTIKNPESFYIWVEFIKKKRYEKCLLVNIDADKVINKLDEIMGDEKIYTDELLTIKKLAEKVSLTPHQLSQLINEKLDTNFNGLINKYRIKEAKTLLLENLNLTVLAIGYKVGFNSNSVFYTAFKNDTGFSPNQYRQGKR